jgi:lipid-A-disaccharide synthase-like uncharacterized protein
MLGSWRGRSTSGEARARSSERTEVSVADWRLDPFWFVVGMVGQAVFFSRFVVQWIVSERAGRSTIPRAFWWLSLAGAGLLLVYALHRKDLVFVLGQSFGWLVYTRNLVLLRRSEIASR